ncbi:MAG: glutamate synthase, partial [Muribaculaceae bacterium]|nr:glutamate synthase [Muribaculaceae bacterium]
MGNPKAFLSINRKEAGYRPVMERILDYGEVEQTLNTEDRRLQASRCMECGVPFCHWSCPLGNRQPEWQDALYRNDIKTAYTLLTMTDDFPEFTGRVCPALCEKGCVLNKEHQAVTIRENEAAIVERAFAEGLVNPNPPARRTGKRVAVIGSGPAGLAAANRLNHAGHSVVV